MTGPCPSCTADSLVRMPSSFAISFVRRRLQRHFFEETLEAVGSKDFTMGMRCRPPPHACRMYLNSRMGICDAQSGSGLCVTRRPWPPLALLIRASNRRSVAQGTEGASSLWGMGPQQLRAARQS